MQPITANADSPLPPPSYKHYNSPSISCAAATDPERNLIEVLRPQFFHPPELSAKRVLWTVPQWARKIFVADNCQFIISLYGGLNLLTHEDKRPDTVVFSLHLSDGTKKTLPLSALYDDLNILPATASHLAWYSGVGWNGAYLTVHTIDGRQVKISRNDFE